MGRMDRTRAIKTRKIRPLTPRLSSGEPCFSMMSTSPRIMKSVFCMSSRRAAICSISSYVAKLSAKKRKKEEKKRRKKKEEKRNEREKEKRNMEGKKVEDILPRNQTKDIVRMAPVGR